MPGMSGLDSTLIAFIQGDERAFHHYYVTYYDALCLFATRIIKDEEICRDIAQNVFINLWKARGTIESELHLKMYLYQSMRHRCMNYLKSLQLEEKYRYEYRLLESEEDYRNMVVEEEVHRLVMEEINLLPEEQRRVILLHLEGKRNIEIAEAMEISVNTVKTHKARARQQLKVKLKDLFFVALAIGV